MNGKALTDLLGKLVAMWEGALVMSEKSSRECHTTRKIAVLDLLFLRTRDNASFFVLRESR